MKRLGFLFLVAVGLSAALLMYGCGDDDKSPSGPKLQTGDPEDPEFVLMQRVIDEDVFVEMTQFMLWMSMATMDLVFDSAAAAPVGREFAAELGLQVPMLTYHEDSKYWYLAAPGPFGMNSILVDSIQFLHASGPVRYPESTLVVRVNTGCVLVTMAEPYLTIGQKVSLTGDVVDLGDVVLSGTQFIEYPLGEMVTKQGVMCVGDMSASGLFTNVGMNLDGLMETGECPTSGTAEYGIVLHGVCATDEITTLDDFWKLRQMFDDGTITTYFDHENTRWVDTTLCGPIAVGPKLLLEEIMEAAR